ncbi:MAG: hypothetical protein NWE94_06410 [Candidatus Bathyarchaeota archaeon]|nr:hypothetical protein [Candidatus Bathyarchaeota archaeon]
MKNHEKSKTKALLRQLALCSIYALAVLLIDFAIILLLKVESARVTSSLSLIGLLEGGTALIIGSAVAMYSPMLTKAGEIIFRSETWDAKRRKQVEHQGKTLITTGAILVLAALVVSAL